MTKALVTFTSAVGFIAATLHKLHVAIDAGYTKLQDYAERKLDAALDALDKWYDAEVVLAAKTRQRAVERAAQLETDIIVNAIVKDGKTRKKLINQKRKVRNGKL